MADGRASKKEKIPYEELRTMTLAAKNGERLYRFGLVFLMAATAFLVWKLVDSHAELIKLSNAMRAEREECLDILRADRQNGASSPGRLQNP